jgi:hypothetical protein
MSSPVHLEIIHSAEEYERLRRQRLTFNQMTTSALYLMALKVERGHYPGVTAPIMLERLEEYAWSSQLGTVAGHATIQFLDSDYRPVISDQAEVRDEILRLDTGLELQRPHRGDIKEGFILPLESGLSDDDRRAFEALSLSLAGSRSGEA